MYTDIVCGHCGTLFLIGCVYYPWLYCIILAMPSCILRWADHLHVMK